MKNISHNDYLDSFLDSVWAEQGLSKNTLVSYEHDIKSFLIFLNDNKVELFKVTEILSTKSKIFLFASITCFFLTQVYPNLAK